MNLKADKLTVEEISMLILILEDKLNTIIVSNEVDTIVKKLRSIINKECEI